MFAFCPRVNQKICGVVDGEPVKDMTLLASVEKTGKVKTNTLLYQKQGFDPHLGIGIGSEEASYDACHYMITMDKSILDKWDPTSLNVRIINKSADLNLYIWEGLSRVDAPKSVIPNNEQA